MHPRSGARRQATIRRRHEAGRMATVHEQSRAPAEVRPPLTAAGGEPVTVVHLTAEYFPYARTGGLAEAVSGLAHHPAGRRAQRGGDHAALPERPRRRARPRAGRPAVPGVDRRPDRGGPALPRGPGGRRAAGLLPRALEYFDRPGIYGENAVDYPDNARRFAFFALAALTALPRLVPGPVLLHAHDWHTALAPVYLRTTLAGERFAASATTVLSVHNPGYQGHFPPETMPELGLPWELYNWQQLEWYGKVNFLKGGLVFADSVTTVSPTQARELRTPAAASACTTCSSSWATGSSASSTASTSGSGTRPPTPQITAQYTAEEFDGKRRCKAALQRSFGLPQRRKVPLFGMTGRLVTQKGLDLILGGRRAARRWTRSSSSSAAARSATSRRWSSWPVRARPDRGPARLHRPARAPAHGRRRHLPDAVAVRALRPDADAGAALRRAADRPARRRARRHGRRRRDRLPVRGVHAGGVHRGGLPRARRLRRPRPLAGADARGMARDFSWERSVADVPRCLPPLRRTRAR